MNSYFVYIVTNKMRTVLYTGVTGNLTQRIYQHEKKTLPGFTSRYNANELIYYEEFPTAPEAIAAEKKIKGWNRERKLWLIRTKNPDLQSLNSQIYDL